MYVAGGARGKGTLTFLFSTEKDRGFSATDYQRFVTGIKQAVKEHTVETIGLERFLFLAEEISWNFFS